jgi:hypothetical protein
LFGLKQIGEQYLMKVVILIYFQNNNNLKKDEFSSLLQHSDLNEIRSCTPWVRNKAAGCFGFY